MSRNIVYFDLETQKSASDVGGWNHIDKMGMSVGVTYSTARGDYVVYGEGQVEELIKEHQRADLVVGFNQIRFDYKVLEGYSIFDFSQVPSLDMLIEVNKALGHKIPLDSIAQATLYGALGLQLSIAAIALEVAVRGFIQAAQRVFEIGTRFYANRGQRAGDLARSRRRFCVASRSLADGPLPASPLGL